MGQQNTAILNIENYIENQQPRHFLVNLFCCDCARTLLGPLAIAPLMFV